MVDSGLRQARSPALTSVPQGSPPPSSLNRTQLPPSRSLITLYPDTRREHHPAAPHACEPPSGQFHQRVPRPPRRRPRTRFLPRSTRPHSPNPHLRCWTIPVNLPIAPPTSLSVLRVQMPPCPRSGFFPEPV